MNEITLFSRSSSQRIEVHAVVSIRSVFSVRLLLAPVLRSKKSWRGGPHGSKGDGDPDGLRQVQFLSHHPLVQISHIHCIVKIEVAVDDDR